MAVFSFAIVPKNVWEHEGAKVFGLHPIGTGPFMVKSATPGFTKITEVRNPYYWRSGEPYLNELVFNQVESDNARILGVRSGAATITQGIPYAQVASLEKTPGVKMLVGPEWGATDNLFNRAKAPFNEVNVRKALMYATPREEIIKAVYKGIGTPANSMWGKVKYWDPNVPLYPYDLAKAKELLKASSVPNGFNMTINIADGETEGELLASILQSSWAQIGVHATIQSISAATLFTDFFAGKYQFLVLAPEDGLLTGDDPSAASGYFESPEAGYGPPAGPKIVGLLRKATTSTGEALRTKLFGELQYDSYFQEPVAQVIVNLVTLNLVSNSLHGFQVLPNSFTRMELAWVQK
jgi:peptide/nickel transport system substrate-binding protein